MPTQPDRVPIVQLRLAFVAVIIFTCVLMLLLAEVAVRVRQAIRYGSATTAEDYLTHDSRTGLRVPVANLKLGSISTNSHGFRGPEITVPKPPGTVRLAFVGASTTWSGEVSGNDRTWPHLVTDAMREAFPKARFDYVNAGVPGYTTGPMLANFEHRVAPLQPDVVVIYELSNNLSGELRELAFKRGLISEPKMRELSWPARYSLLWALVEKNLQVRGSQKTARSGTARLEVDPGTLGEGYRQGLTRLVHAAQQQAGLVAVATFSIHLRRDQSAEQQFRASESSFYYMPFATTSLLIDAYERYNQVVREVAQDTGAVLIEGENDIPGDFTHFADAVHFTDAGSKIMAQRISRALLAMPALRAAADRNSAPH